jgi:hypothetical protein
VSAASAGHVTFGRNTTKAFVATDRLIPARLCYLGSSQKLGFETDAAQRAVVHFRASVGLGIGYPGGDAPSTYLGRDLFSLKPNWASGYGQEVVRGLTVDDFQLGAFQERPRTTAPRVATPMEVHLASRQAIADFLAFLSRRKGRVAPFWCPSRVSDLKLLVDMGPSESVMTVENCGYSNLVNRSTVRQDVYIRLGSGTAICRQITACQVDPLDETQELLTLDSAVGVTVDIGDIRCLSFLESCRLDQDRVEIGWLTNQVATCALTRIAVPEDPEEQHPSVGGGIEIIRDDR